MIRNLITIQHAQSEHHLNGMVGSWNDWPLTELGQKQAENIGRNLSAELAGQSYKICCSDLTRARQTAAPLSRYMGIEVEYREELREWNLGSAIIGKSKQWVDENSQPVKTLDDRRFPDAESTRDFWNRISAFYDELSANDYDHIIIVSHGAWLWYWPAIWLGLDIKIVEKGGFYGSAGSVSFMGETGEGKRLIRRLNDSWYMKNPA